MPEVTQQAVEPGSAHVVQLRTRCGLRGHLARGESPCLVCGEALSAAISEPFRPEVAQRPLSLDFPPQDLGRGPGNRAHDWPVHSKVVAAARWGQQRLVSQFFKCPLQSLINDPIHCPPHVICLCHQKMPSESYFAFPPISCFL